MHATRTTSIRACSSRARRTIVASIWACSDALSCASSVCMLASAFRIVALLGGISLSSLGTSTDRTPNSPPTWSAPGVVSIQSNAPPHVRARWSSQRRQCSLQRSARSKGVTHSPAGHASTVGPSNLHQCNARNSVSMKLNRDQHIAIFKGNNFEIPIQLRCTTVTCSPST
jgi:hypothetical protein